MMACKAVPLGRIPTKCSIESIGSEKEQNRNEGS